MTIRLTSFAPLQIVLAFLVFCQMGWSPAAAQSKRSKKDKFRKVRLEMVETAVKGAGITNPQVIKSIQETPRHEFMPKKVWDQAYLDAGIPIGEGQTISSPFIVAYMTESLDPQPTDRVLEIGTGSGYQAAVLSPLVKDVYTIEIVEPLGKRAARVLKKLGYDNVHVKIGDGFKGWPEHAPFDKIILTCSPEQIPQPLVDQLKEGGLIVVPMGQRHQQTLYLLKKVDGELETQPLRPTLFVPMTGKAEDQREVLPDPTRPRILNGDFEEGLDDEGFVKGWYYQRKCELVEEVLAPSGQHYVKFKNDVPGQFSWLMQGFAIDGRAVSKLRLSASIACDSVAAGPHRNDLPLIAIQFLAEDRSDLNTVFIGPFQGTMTWKNFDREFPVPVGAREAILRIGLFGATGSASFDNIIVRKVESEESDD